jgi:uncharacterized membrane protein
MIFWTLVLWGLLGWGLWALLRGAAGTAPERRPEHVLRHRFAAGELNAEAHSQAQSVLAGRDGVVARAPPH